jgi:hypothetical protein
VSRYVVTELEGYLQLGGDRRRPLHAKPGLSVQVIDRATCHRVVASFRSEDYGGRHDRAREIARHKAAKRCAELNGTSPPSIVASIGLRATCRNNHPQTAATTYLRADGTRRCLLCRREQWKRTNAKRRARRTSELPQSSRPIPAADLSPACPRCGNLCEPDALYCVECGARLYLISTGKYAGPHAPPEPGT